MFRISLIVCVSLIFGITAKPWNKLTDEVIQKAVLSMDDNGKMSLGVEVEPPEDMDEIQYDIDPKMRIWKSMADSKQDQQPWMDEEDQDDLDEEILETKANVKYSVAAEEDEDDIDLSEVTQEEPEQEWDEDKAREVLSQYLAPLVAKDIADMGVRGALSENDEDDLGSPVQMEPLRREMRSESDVRVHLQPEQDMDDLYHKDPVMPVLYQEGVGAVAPADLPSWKKHSEPEEDLDHLHHQ